jgi:hypothetical protein
MVKMNLQTLNLIMALLEVAASMTSFMVVIDFIA